MTTSFNPYNFKKLGKLDNIIQYRSHHYLNADYTRGDNYRIGQTNNFFTDGFFISMGEIVEKKYDFVYISNNFKADSNSKPLFGFFFLALS